jgi:Leucine-rich repeat (LRR) protein
MPTVGCSIRKAQQIEAKVRPKRSWLRFSLKTLFCLTALIAICFGLLVSRALRQQRAVDAVHKLGGMVVYDYQVDSSGEYVPGEEPPWPRWLRDIFGPHYFDTVVAVNLQDLQVSDDDLRCLTDLTRLYGLALGNTNVSDGSLQYIEGLSELRGLGLYDTQITDASIEHLARLANLESLLIGGTHITDEGAATLHRRLPHCEIER